MAVSHRRAAAEQTARRARRLLEHHLDGSVENFTVYDEYSTIYPKAFVALTEGAIKRMRDGNGRIVAITNPGCNIMQIPRVGYDMPGQAKATMEFLVRMYALRLASRRLCVNAVSHRRRLPQCTEAPLAREPGCAPSVASCFRGRRACVGPHLWVATHSLYALE